MKCARFQPWLFPTMLDEDVDLGGSNERGEEIRGDGRSRLIDFR